MILAIKTPTGRIVEASKLHMMLMDCDDVVYG